MVEFVHGLVNFVPGHSCQVPTFRKVLADESVGIFVQSALEGGISVGEIDTGIKVTGQAFVVSEFPTIVIGDGVTPQ